MSDYIKQFRAENPVYDDMPDDQLVTALHNKYYSDIPIEQFNQKIGFQVAPIEPVQQDNLPVDASLGTLPGNNLPLQQETLPAQQIPQQPTIDGYTGAATKAPEEMSMLELVGGKLENWGAGAGERAGGVGGALLSTIQTVGEGIEHKLPMGGFVWEDGDIIPSYKSPEEWAQTDAEPILNKGAEVLKGVDLGYQEKVGWEDVKKSFSEGGPLSASAYADVLEYGIEQGVKSVPDMVAAIYSLPTYIFARSGEIGEQRAQNKGKEKAELEDVLEAAPFAVASSLLERIGAKGITQAGKEEIGKEILKAGIKESTKRVAKAGGKALTKEAGTEAIQEGMIEYVGERYGTDVAMDWKEALDRAAAGAVAGGVFGGAGGLATSAANEINYSPDKVIAKQLERDIEATDVVGTEQAAIEALSPEQAQIQQDQKPQQKQELKTKEPQTKAEPVKPVTKQEFEIDKTQATEQEPVALELPEEKPVKQKIVGKEVVEAPIEEITISEDVPQFKEGANVKGVVEPLGGKFERTGVAPVQIWVREDGRKEVISGRHRLDLAERSGEKTIPAQYHYESEGFGADQAAVLDAMLNIREGQGKVKDYVDFIKATKPRKTEAESQGILARQTGKRAFTIATEGSDALITSHRNDQLTDEAATRIAEAAPRNEKLQAVGIKALQDGKSIAVAENMVKAVKTMTDETAQQSGDLFGFDDSAMVEAENLAKAAVKKQNEIQRTLSAVQGAAKRPELAAKEGVDVKNPEAIKARIAELKEQKRDWQNWHTNPKLTQELKAQPEKAVTDEKPAITEEAKAPTPEPEAQPSTKEKDTFTNWNAKDSEGGLAEQSFTRGEYAKAVKSDKDKTFFDGGEIEGISQAKQQAKIKGVWHDFGSIVKADKPEPVKKPTKPMSEVVEAVSKKKGKGLTDADKVPTPKADYATEPVKAHKDFYKSVTNKSATKESVKSNLTSLLASKDKVFSNLKVMTNNEIAKAFNLPNNRGRKDKVIQSAWEQMLNDHVMRSGVMTTFNGSPSIEKLVSEQVRKQTDTDLKKYFESVAEEATMSRDGKIIYPESPSEDINTKEYKDSDKLSLSVPKDGERVFHAPGHNFIGMFRSTGIPERRDFVTIEGRKLKIPDAPQRIEPIMSKLIKITGRRIYFGKIKGKSAEGFYRPNVGEIRTRRKNDVEVLAHEMAHYLDVYSNITLPNFQKLYKDPKYSSEVAALSYTDADPKIEKIEGFAEFVRLWLTNANEAQLRAPKFYDAFTNELARDRKLLNPMRDMQDLMHKFYFQGPDKLGQALIGQDVSFKQRFNEWAYRRDSRIRQQVIDRFHAARKVEQELSRKIGTVEESAWKQFRIANGGAEGISDYILNYGTVQFDEKGDLKRSGKSLHEVMEPVKTIKLKPEHEGDQKIDLLMRYFAGRRALELHRQKRENLIPKETAKEWARLGKDYPVFESIQKEYQQFNDRMMDFYEEAGMVTPEGRKTMQSMNKDYVPFNRIRDQLAGGKGAASAGFQKLKGGTANLNDILVNIQDGITANVRSALNNRAKQRLYQYISGHKDGAIFATKIAPDSKPVQVYADEMQAKISKVLETNGIEIEGDLDLASKELLTFWQHGVAPKVNESGNIVDSVIINGKPKYYEVQDPLLQEMLMSMNPESYSSFMNVMFGVKNFFTRTITLGIEFTGANLVRDTVGATFLSKNNFKPFISSFQGMYSFLAKDKYYQDFIRSGGGHSSRLEGATRDSQARRRVKLDEFGVMTGPERLLSSIDNLASAFEYGTRIGEYRLAKKNMKSDMDAGFDAREISTDFSVLGANRFLTGYIRTVPFLNAMVQSQDRVFREAAVSKRYDGNPTAMAMKAFLGITVPTLILYLVNKDDEDYKAIPDYEKRTNWHIKIGDGQFVKIPRPYDVGFVYATMPELFAKYVEDDKGKEFADGMIWTMTQMYGIDGTPAMMTGWWDLVRNEKWTGAPVVPQSLSDVEAPEQYTSNTSETFVRMGEALGVSPIKAEHMFKAYTGYLGGYLMAGTDHLLWDESKFGEKPDRKLSENVFLRRFLTPDVRPATANMEKFFNLKEQSDKIVSTFKQTVDVRRQIKGQGGTGKFKDDKFYGLSGKEKEVLFGLNDSMNQLIKLMYGKEGIKTAELKIKYDKNLSGKEKREQMDKLWLARNKAFETYYNQANQALQKAKREAKQEK